MPKNVFCFVSRYHGSGKNHAARCVANASYGFADVIELTEDLKAAAGHFSNAGKDTQNELGVTLREIVLAISGALCQLHHDLPVHRVKKTILIELNHAGAIIIPDCRRKEEFEWLRSLSNVKVHVIEVVPTDSNGLLLDSWITDDIIKVWGEGRFTIVNDFSSEFNKEIVEYCLTILESDDSVI